MEKKYILGVDAGGTKTEAAVASLSGKILGIGVSGTGNIKDLPPREISKNIRTAIQKAVKAAKLPKNTRFEISCFGLAGLDNLPNDRNLAKEITSKTLPPEILGKTILVNDLEIIFRTGTASKYGVAVVAGTGSNFYGINKSGKEFRPISLIPPGNWKDPGSGFTIGKTALEKGLIKASAGAAMSRKQIAKLALVVEKKANKGNKLASKILEDAAKELAGGVIKTIKVLRLKNKRFDVVCSGGVFRLKYPIKKIVKENVLGYSPKANIIFPKNKPVTGAVKMAMDNIPLKRSCNPSCD